MRARGSIHIFITPPSAQTALRMLHAFPSSLSAQCCGAQPGRCRHEAACDAPCWYKGTPVLEPAEPQRCGTSRLHSCASSLRPDDSTMAGQGSNPRPEGYLQAATRLGNHWRFNDPPVQWRENDTSP